MYKTIQIRGVGNVSASKHARILRVKNELSEEEISKAIKKYIDSRGGMTADYPEHELVQLGLSAILEGVVNKFTGKEIDLPILIDTKTDVCSTLVSEIWRMAGIPLKKAKNLTPGDLERSKKTYVIKDYKDVI